MEDTQVQTMLESLVEDFYDAENAYHVYKAKADKLKEEYMETRKKREKQRERMEHLDVAIRNLKTAYIIES